MMGANVTDINNAMQPRSKDSIGQPEIIRYFPFRFSGKKIVIQDGQRAERSNLHRYPTWWKGIGIFGFESRYKFFIATLVLFINLQENLGMAHRIVKTGSIGKPIAVEPERKNISCLCPYRDFYLFQFRNNQLTKFTIKFINIVCRIECAAGLELVALLICQQGIPITA